MRDTAHGEGQTVTTGQRPIGEPGIAELPEQRIAYINMRGPYEQYPEAIQRLLEWIESVGAEIVAPPGGTYKDDPSTTPPDQLDWDAWAPIAPSTPEQERNADGIGVVTVPAGRYASVLHKGPYEGIPASYGLLFTWLAQQQIQPAAPPMEVYLSDPAEVAEADLITEVRVQIMEPLVQ